MKIVLTAAGAGLALLLAGIALDPVRGFSALLAAGFTGVACALGGLALLALLQVGNAGFHATIKRVLEAMGLALPACGLALIAVLFGARYVYPWAAADDPVRGAWLNLPAFSARMLLFLGVWTAFALLLRRHSLAQDADADLRHTRSGVALSAVFLLTGGYTLSLAGVDWLMSTDPHWASTMSGFYCIGSVLLTGTAAAIVAVIALRRSGRLPEANENHLHDLGKLLFGLATLWAYLWFSQFLLVWYANLPEETHWILTRTHGGWAPLFYANLLIGWLVPFVALLPRPAKRSENSLLAVALLVLFGRFLDAWVIVAPSNLAHPPALLWVELAAVAAVAGIFVLAVQRALQGAPMVPRNDPYLIEALGHHT